MLVFACVLGIPTALQATDFQPVSADELKMTSEPKAPGASAIILFREVDRDDAGFHEDIYYRIKILAEEGRRRADIEIPYWKDAIKISKLHARTIKPDGSIINFDGKPFDKTIVKARGVKYRVLSLTLPDVSVGSIIEYFYTIEFTQRFVFDSYWILNDDLFTKSAKFSLKPAMHAALHLHVKWQHLPPGVEPVIVANQPVHLEVSDMAAFQVEDFMPPENELKARVDFIYADSYESDPDKFWKTFGRTCYDLLEKFIAKPNAMEQAVAEVVSPSDPPDVKLEKIYARTQQLRNLSYEATKTAQEHKREKEKLPSSAEEVWKLQRGTAAQLTWLFVGLARAAGIEVYGVWVSDRENFFFTPETMDSYRLDTNVALVKLNGKDLYLDPGAAYIPFGFLPWSETGVIGYKLDKDGGSWIKTTLPESGRSRIQRKAQLKLTTAGDLEGKLSVTYTGLEASIRRVEQRFSDDAERRKVLEEEIKDSIPVPIEVQLASQPDWKSSSPSMVVEFELKVPDWASAAGSRTAVSVGLFGAGEKHLFEHGERVHPIYFQFPFQLVDDITVELPTGWQILNLPEPAKRDIYYVAYTLEVGALKDAFQLHRALKVDATLVSVDTYPALRAFFQTVRTADEQQVLLQSIPAGARN